MKWKLVFIALLLIAGMLMVFTVNVALSSTVYFSTSIPSHVLASNSLGGNSLLGGGDEIDTPAYVA